MQLHFGHGGRLTHLPPRHTQFLIATVVKLEFLLTYCKQRAEIISNRNKILPPLNLTLCASLISAGSDGPVSSPKTSAYGMTNLYACTFNKIRRPS